MHFDTKSYLKSTRNHTAKHALITMEHLLITWVKGGDKNGFLKYFLFKNILK
jgi:hypothetical protein